MLQVVASIVVHYHKPHGINQLTGVPDGHFSSRRCTVHLSGQTVIRLILGSHVEVPV